MINKFANDARIGRLYQAGVAQIPHHFIEEICFLIHTKFNSAEKNNLHRIL